MISKSHADPRDSGFDIQNNLGSSIPSLNRRECHIGVSKDIRRDDPIIQLPIILSYRVAFN